MQTTSSLSAITLSSIGSSEPITEKFCQNQSRSPQLPTLEELLLRGVGANDSAQAKIGELESGHLKSNRRQDPQFQDKSKRRRVWVDHSKDELSALSKKGSSAAFENRLGDVKTKSRQATQDLLVMSRLLENMQRIQPS